MISSASLYAWSLSLPQSTTTASLPLSGISLSPARRSALACSFDVQMTTAVMAYAWLATCQMQSASSSSCSCESVCTASFCSGSSSGMPAAHISTSHSPHCMPAAHIDTSHSPHRSAPIGVGVGTATLTAPICAPKAGSLMSTRPSMNATAAVFAPPARGRPPRDALFLLYSSSLDLGGAVILLFGTPISFAFLALSSKICFLADSLAHTPTGIVPLKLGSRQHMPLCGHFSQYFLSSARKPPALSSRVVVGPCVKHMPVT